MILEEEVQIVNCAHALELCFVNNWRTILSTVCVIMSNFAERREGDSKSEVSEANVEKIPKTSSESDSEIAAATKIQASYRGYKTRKSLKELGEIIFSIICNATIKPRPL